jgi:asparagine synthase (glutamine-hydrolysing)
MRNGFPLAHARVLKKMGEVIAHRGPDASGEFLDERIGLVHRRLSIIDLSPLGNQPMLSGDGRYVLVFNGEIYNFLELRTELEELGCTFKSRTDTEVILELYRLEGVHCLTRLNGMFALALWDREARSLLLARDRIGKKPLYYYHGGGDRLAFASEIKSLLQLPGVCRDIEPSAITDYLKYLYIPAPKTIFKGIYKLLPGHYLELRSKGEPIVTQYWDVDFSCSAPDMDEEEAAAELRDLVASSTASRMISDVPLGAFLSGGVDSSAIVAMMARVSAAPVKTCSIGFNDERHDETRYAREVAGLFHTDHVEYVVGRDVAATVTCLPRFFDEPFADSSAVPTFHVSRLARQEVTVALAGDGGDENFGGYDKYATDLKQDLVRRFVPRFCLQAMRGVAAAGGGSLMRRASSLAGNALADPGRSYYQTNTFISDRELGRLLTTPLQVVCRGYDPAGHTLVHWNRLQGADFLTRMLYTDIKSYLPGDILVKVDRMSMAHSLEVRAPLLDYRVVEFAATLPARLKIRGGEKKLLLKKAFSTELPGPILYRRKHGFTVPLDGWFRGELRALGEQHLLESHRIRDYFAIARVREIWQEHQEKRANHGTLLWSLLCFSLWQQEYMN